MPGNAPQVAKLALEDGSVFTGLACGADGTSEGEVVFNTAHTGYQEIFTDPSYCGQIVVMTFPLMGNYGVNPEDFESRQPHLAGFVVRQVPPRPSNFRATASLEGFLREHNIIGICEVDSRAITRRVRIQGALRGVITTEAIADAELVRRAQGVNAMSGTNLVDLVAPLAVSEWSDPVLPSFAAIAPPNPTATNCHIVAIDCGIKHNILRFLAGKGCRVTVVPAGTPAAAVAELKPDGILVGNGPGDPAAVTATIEQLRSLFGLAPMFGICLGHQMIALALGAETYKLRFGHHGANVPVLNQPAERVEITSQNHGFAVDVKSLERAGGTVSHINLNDQSLEGFIHENHRIMTVQFHPEAAPGPHDSGYLFERFVDACRNGKPINRALLAEPLAPAHIS